MGYGQYSVSGVNSADQSREARDEVSRLSAYDAQRESVRRQNYGSHSNTAHVWAQNKVAGGRSNDGRMYFADGVIYSYGSHFPIARFLDQTFDEKRVVLFTQARHSISTSAHCREADSALANETTIVIPVPTLKDWPNEPSVADVRDTLIDRVMDARRGIESEKGKVGEFAMVEYFQRHLARHELTLAAFVALYPSAGGIPDDMAAYIEARNNARRAAESERKRAESLETLATYAREIPRHDLSAFETPTTTYKADKERRSAERIMKNAARALIAFNKARALTSIALYPGHAETPFDAKALAGKAREVKRESKARVDAMLKLHAELTRAEQREQRIHTIEFLARHARIDDLRLTGGSGQDALNDAIELAPALAPVLLTRISQAHFMNEINDSFRIQNPDATHIVQRRKVPRPRAIDPLKWQFGEGNASQSFDRVYVRRKGANLETSLGAIAPFNQSVTIFRAAQACRFTGKSFRKNGQRLPVGSFEVDAIDTSGNLVAGCHSIKFADMLALAIREVPATVKSRFPVPAIVRG